MEEFLNQTYENADEDVVTPESLAWRLLIDDDVADYAGILLPFVANDNNIVANHISNDNLADQFQILITMYMEMLFGMLKINHINSFINSDGELDDSIDLETTFKPDISKFTIEDLLGTFRDRFAKIRVFLSVRGIYDSDETNSRDYGSNFDYYCRIILKNSVEGNTYFKANSHWLDPEKLYTFAMRNDDKKRQKKLDDFFAVCTLPNLKVKVAFSPINVHVQKSHIL
jgi:hypothetical protein